MDENSLVRDEIESGKRFIEALIADGFEVAMAFWAKRTEADDWKLYIVSPVVEAQDRRVAYDQVLNVSQRMPSLGIGLFGIKVLGVKDGLAERVSQELQRKLPGSRFADGDPNLLPRVIRLGEFDLGGTSYAGAYVYTMAQATASP
jgi:hypothetical protein